MSCGFFYILMGLFAATLTSLLMSFPHLFIVALAGIALFGTISHNIAIAFHEVKDREAATAHLLIQCIRCSVFWDWFRFLGTPIWIRCFVYFKL